MASVSVPLVTEKNVVHVSQQFCPGLLAVYYFIRISMHYKSNYLYNSKTVYLTQ